VSAMIDYVAYEPTGRILRWGFCREDELPLQVHDGIPVVQGKGMTDTHYVDLSDPENPVVVERPVSTVVLSQEGGLITLTGVMSGAQIRVTGDAELEVENDDEGGTVVLSFPDKGKYLVEVEQFPQLPFAQLVTV